MSGVRPPRRLGHAMNGAWPVRPGPQDQEDKK